jgi:glycosyltransferase involved in cell wall biosynthesis
VGAPHLEPLKAYTSPGIRGKHGRSARRRLRLSGGSKIVLYTPHSFRKGSRGGLAQVHNTRPEAEELLDAVLGTLRDARGVELVVKLHHADDNLAFYRERFRTTPSLRCRVVRQAPIHELINASHVVVSPLSTVVLEAILIGRPVVLADFRGRSGLFPYSEYGAVDTVQDERSLRAVLRAVLNDESAAMARTAEGRRRIAREMAMGNDGRSGKRLSALLDGLLARERAGAPA